MASRKDAVKATTISRQGAMLAPIRLTNAGSCPSRQRDCVATAARSAETKGTAQLPCGSGETQGEGMPLHFKLDRALAAKFIRRNYAN